MPVFQVEMRWRCSACQTEVLGRHKTCPTCGKPKNAEEFYSAQAATVDDAVTDPQLLELATAGEDWECGYCQNRQGNAHQACTGCGAPRVNAAAPDAALHTDDSSGSEREVSSRSGDNGPAQARSVGVALICWAAAAIWLVTWLSSVLGPRDVEAHVVSRLWKHTVSIERYQIVNGQGFSETRPADAFDVELAGQRHHHDTQVPNGTTRESYTQRVACGQDCRTTSVSCRSNNNGFKTCSGGDRVCSTRYCSEVRYRTVPRYATVSVDAPWYRWRAWQWKPQRVIEKTGSEEAPFWPDDTELALNVGCRGGERERAERQAVYEVVFADAKNEQHPYRPRDVDEFRQLTPGTSKTLHVVPGLSTEIVQDDEGAATKGTN